MPVYPSVSIYLSISLYIYIHIYAYTHIYRITCSASGDGAGSASSRCYTSLSTYIHIVRNCPFTTVTVAPPFTPPGIPASTPTEHLRKERELSGVRQFKVCHDYLSIHIYISIYIYRYVYLYQYTSVRVGLTLTRVRRFKVCHDLSIYLFISIYMYIEMPRINPSTREHTHTHRELIREWLWERKGSSPGYIYIHTGMIQVGGGWDDTHLTLSYSSRTVGH